MRLTVGNFSKLLVAGCLMAAALSRASAQAPARSSIVIPLKKEKATPAKVVTIHDTVTMVRVDTVRVVETVVRTDTLFKVDTLRDSCSSGGFLIPVPIPLSFNHHDTSFQPATLDPGGAPTGDIPTSVTPEPETFVMVGTGLAAMIGFSWYKRRK
jgi:hypothetical protein